MKFPVITCHQPWAHLLVHGLKDYENRNWALDSKLLNVPILVHATKKYDLDELGRANRIYKSLTNKDLHPRSMERRGGIVGWVMFDDCVAYNQIKASQGSPWYEGFYGFHVSKYGTFEEMIDFRARQGKILYTNISAEVAEQIKESVEY